MALLTQAHPPLWAYVSALVSGVLGLVGNAFLVGFFVMSSPDFADSTWGWLGFTNDVIVAGQFLALVPVIYAVARLLPASRVVTATTVLALIATAGIVVLSVALVVGLLSFDVQVKILIGFLVPVYGWLLVASSVGHRANALPRSVTTVGLLLGVSWPAALLLTVAGLLVGGVDLSSMEFGLPGVLLVIPALVLGTLNWLALPGWPLLLAATVFRPRRIGARAPRAADPVDLRAGR